MKIFFDKAVNLDLSEYSSSEIDNFSKHLKKFTIYHKVRDKNLVISVQKSCLEESDACEIIFHLENTFNIQPKYYFVSDCVSFHYE